MSHLACADVPNRPRVSPAPARRCPSCLGPLPIHPACFWGRIMPQTSPGQAARFTASTPRPGRPTRCCP
jgi:hypothetical protein